MNLFLFVISFFINLETISVTANNDESIENDNKIIKAVQSDSIENNIEKKSNIFIRKSGGIGQPVKFYIMGSTSNQVTASIEGFNNSAPSLSQFGLMGLNFGLFDEATIETKNIINNSYLNNHSGNINLNLSNKNYAGITIGSFNTNGFLFNNKVKNISFGGVKLYSKNNFPYIDIHNNERIRKNNNFDGINLYVKAEDKNYKLLNSFSMSQRGVPGSNQFEHLTATISTLENLLGIDLNKKINNFSINLKNSYNFKQYNYFDDNPKRIGVKEIDYNLNLNNTITEINTKYSVDNYIFSLFLINNFYSADLLNNGKEKEVTENDYSIGLNAESFYFDDKLNISLSGKMLNYKNNYFLYETLISYLFFDEFKSGFNYKKGIRTPYFEEKYYISCNVEGNPDLEPEILNGFSFFIKFNKIINGEIEFYYNKFENNISFVQTSFYAMKAINSKSATAKGFNVNLKYNHKYFNIENNFSYNISKLDNNYITPFNPKFKNNFTFNLLYKLYYFGFNVNYSSKYYTNIFNTEYIPYKLLLNSYLGYKNNDFEIKLEVENILNKKEYYDYLHEPLPSRSYFIKAFIYF